MGRATSAAVSLLLALLLAGCSPLVVVNGITPNAPRVAADQPYGALDRQQLDVYYPAEGAAAAPVVVFFYGGSWQNGDRSDYAFVGDSLAALGFTVVIPDYRVYPEVRFPAFVADGAAALAWVEANMPEASRGIVVMGHSAGAQIASLLALDERYAAAAGFRHDALVGWIGLAGPYTFNPLKWERTRAVFEGLDDPGQARPVTFACRQELPALLMHGMDDTTVLPHHSARMADAMRECGVPVDYIEMPEVNHFDIVLGLSSSLDGLAEVLPAITDFLQSLET